MKNIFRSLLLAIIIIVTYYIIYLLTANQVNSTINLIVMILLVFITDKYYLTRVMGNNIKFICKSFIWVFIILLIAYFIYNGFMGRLTYDIMDWIPVLVIIFAVLGSLIGYIIIYKIVYFIKLLKIR